MEEEHKDDVLSKKDESLSNKDEVLSKKDEVLSKKDEILNTKDGNEILSKKSKSVEIFNKIKPYLIVYRNNRDIIFTLYSAIWFFFCTYVVSLANSYADRTNTNVNLEAEEEPYIAPDVFLTLFKNSKKAFDWVQAIPEDIADTIVRTSAALIICRALTLKSMSLTVTRRVLLIMGFLYLLRACFIPLTVLPTPWVTCQKAYKPNIFYDAILLVLQLRVACGDVFYSGHTIMFTLSILEYWYYCKKAWINVIVTILNVVGMFTLILGAYHYSIDVLCAFIFSIIFWTIYHWSISIPQLAETWWGNIINYFDDPFYYEGLPLYETDQSNNVNNNVDNNNDNQSNYSDITDLSHQQKFDDNENVNQNTIAMFYELNKEKQKNLKNNENNNNEETVDSSEEENIYKRKSILSDTSDNISNLYSIDLKIDTDAETNKSSKKDTYLSPVRISHYYKHPSLNSLKSNKTNRSYASDNIPNILSNDRRHHSSILSGDSINKINPHISIGSSMNITKSNSEVIIKSNRRMSRPKKSNSNKSSNSDSNSNSNSNSSSSFVLNNIVIEGQNISPIQTVQIYEVCNDQVKGENSNNNSNSNHDISNTKPNGVTQFKTNNVEAISVESIHENANINNSIKLTDSPKNEMIYIGESSDLEQLPKL
ncbi:hypothetical protein BCR32DRAFT_269676 [Anaeromyces robustus]|uniref:Sphingomyelin synthase-like domain-containing protein n=1 Tax=Anaeromyces robustus TaxID=1754192 RepID=A0A1Y1X012_9FUNG|nr:hypothetical protein BCR32DRAFT_269676 [Anaeromyces robustus]|eukprot:ORX79063.1 hypothetical protein BCR32DRAFT_269676 [Anaeromyces robustus]